MRTFLRRAAPVSLLLAACGGTVSHQTGGAGAATSSSTAGAGGGATSGSSSTGAGAGTAGSASSSTSGAGGSVHGDCKTSADCSGLPCAPLTPGGYLVCLDPVAEATSCQSMAPPNQCCTTKDCPGADACYPAGKLQSCGGAFPDYNVCAGDACSSDAGCATNQICTPAGAFGYPKRLCLPAYCHTDADCVAKPGGACVPIGGNHCCSLVIPDALVCGYPGDCATGAACPNNGECRLDGTTKSGTCQPQMPCPP